MPLDWSKPDGETIDLALIRAEATGDDRIGSLLFNFGGPGGSGVSTLPAYAGTAADLRERYDLVSWDPRGTGGSGGVRCRDDKAIEAAESTVDWTPDTPAEERVFLEDAADFGKGCQKAAGKLMAHVSTTDTARDMDRIRQALGDDRMHYFGISYGTELGGVYAHLFPGKVGRMILDAVVDPTADTVGHAKNQARGFQTALDNYLRSTGRDPEEGSREIADLLDRMDAEPLPTSSSGRELTQSLAIIGIVLPLYSESSWPALTSALEAAEEGTAQSCWLSPTGTTSGTPRAATTPRPTPSGSYRAWTTSSGRRSRRPGSCCPSSRSSPRLRPVPGLGHGGLVPRLAGAGPVRDAGGERAGREADPGRGQHGRPGYPYEGRVGWRTSWVRASGWCSPGRARATAPTAAAATASTRR